MIIKPLRKPCGTLLAGSRIPAQGSRRRRPQGRNRGRPRGNPVADKGRRRGHRFLSRFRGEVETSGAGRWQAEYFTTLGEAYVLLGRPAEAQPLLERALAVRETGLRNLEQEADKLAWSRGRSEVYHDLLETTLKLKTSADALALSGILKGASLRPAVAVESAAPAGGAPLFSIAPGDVSAPPRDTALISYALLRDSIIAFVLP